MDESLIQTNIKANHVGNNGFGYAFNNVIGMVIDFNHQRLGIVFIFFYFYHIAGKNTQFEQFSAKMVILHVYNKCPLPGLQVRQWFHSF